MPAPCGSSSLPPVRWRERPSRCARPWPASCTGCPSGPGAAPGRFEALVNDVDAAPFLAIADGEPAGLIGFRFRRRLNHATFEGWISDLFVRERSAGGGSGARWSARRSPSGGCGAHHIELEVGTERTAARALYAALGFAEQGRYFEIGPIATRAIETARGVDVRPIEDDDADFEAVTRLLAELGRPAPIEERLPALRRTYTQHVARADTGSLLAELDGVPVGFISLEFRTPSSPARRRRGSRTSW